MNIDEILKFNNHIEIKDVNHRSFDKFGRVIDDYNFNELIQYVENKTFIPIEGNIYVASVPQMESTKVREKLENEFYGEMPIQIGYCNGRNSTLNGVEYHRGSEINIAVTDLILLLGELKDINENKYNANNIEAFYIKEGTSIQMYETTLHFGPCKTSEEGFKCIVVLPRGTNEPLNNDKSKYIDKLLFAKNKWLLAHPKRKLLIEKGAHPGIVGENIEIKIK